MAALTDAELLSMRQTWASRQRKTRSGGKNGGRKKLTPSAVAQPHPKPEAEAPVRERSTALDGFGPCPTIDELFGTKSLRDLICEPLEGE